MNSSSTPESGMGRALKRVFHQDDYMKKVEEQPARVSFLMNDVRRSIFIHLCASPCNHVRGVSRAIGMSAPNTSWHLDKLYEAGYVEKTVVGKKSVFWPKGFVKTSDVKMLALLQKAELRAILKLVNERPEILEHEIVSEMGARQQNVNVWLKSLASEKLLVKEGRGRGLRYALSSRIPKAIEHYGAKARQFSARMIKLLEKDGLRSKKQMLRGTLLSVEVTLPSGKTRLQLECSPVATIGHILK